MICPLSLGKPVRIAEPRIAWPMRRAASRLSAQPNFVFGFEFAWVTAALSPGPLARAGTEGVPSTQRVGVSSSSWAW